MRTITFKGLFLTAVFMLLGSLAIQAADYGLITKQITIKLDEAGTLSGKIGYNKKSQITNLKIVGEINGSDLDFVREMTGVNFFGRPVEGNLSVLDLSEAKIIKGGSFYYVSEDFYYDEHYYTTDDVIGSYTFYKCRNLMSLKLPSGVTEIGSSAFEDCSNLTSLTIPSGVTEIGSSAFYGCTGLTSLSLPSSITEIDSYAFKGCTGLKDVSFYINGDFETYLTKDHPCIEVGCGIKYYLNDEEITSIVVPSSVTTLGMYAFQRCSNLLSVYVSWPTPISAYKTFSETNLGKCTLYVPQGKEQDYWLADVWGDFGNIVEYDPTGIDRVTTSTDAKELSRYSVNGQRLSAPAKGLNIVKYSDGSVKKVAVQ